ncbi:MAG: ribosome-binding factor A [Candidatus Tokpelaia sp. JSC085]|nr:MAG: ribosome-binding factor A [Candidatus Tokpelaia sp. JSC085]
MRCSSPSQRQLRIGEQIRHAIAYMLLRAEIQDPILHGVMLSISEVRMSFDLRIATCFVTSLDNKNIDKLVEALNHHARYIRGQIGKSLRQIRYIPECRFQLDTAFDNFSRIDMLLRSSEVARDLDHG